MVIYFAVMFLKVMLVVCFIIFFSPIRVANFLEGALIGLGG